MNFAGNKMGRQNELKLIISTVSLASISGAISLDTSTSSSGPIP